MFCKGRLAVGAEACGVGTERGLPWSVPAVLHALRRALPPRHFPRLPGTLLLHDCSYLPTLSFSPCFLWVGFVSLTRLSDLQAGLRSTNLWVAEISKTEGQTRGSVLGTHRPLRTSASPLRPAYCRFSLTGPGLLHLEK